MKQTNTKTGNRRLQRLAWSCVLAASLLAGTASTAHAHQDRHDRGPRYEHYYVVDRAPAYPRWLRKHKSFKRWYVHSRYYRQARRQHRQARRYHRHASWSRLYELYLIERLEAVRHGERRRGDYHDHYRDRDYQIDNRRDTRSRRRHYGA